LKELEKAIELCTQLQDGLNSHNYNRYYSFGENVRLLGDFLENDFHIVISALEEARDLIEELEEEKKELEEKVETLKDQSEGLEKRIDELEDEVANAE